MPRPSASPKTSVNASHGRGTRLLKPVLGSALKLGLVVLFLALVTRVSAAELSAGVARVDLTPPLEMNATLGGYGARMSRPAEGVHDPIHAKALVLAAGDRRFVLLTADILGFPPAFKPRLLERLAAAGWTSEQIMLLPSHSHTSIDMNAINPANLFGNKQIGVYHRELFEHTLDRCTQVIQQAASDLTPVVAGTSGRELEGYNRNRRHRDGPVNKQLTVTRLDRIDGTPLAVLVNFAAHPTFMSAEDMLFSGDWPGHLQRDLERAIGSDVVVMYYNGAQGDQSPVRRPASAADRWEVASQYGRDLAGEAHTLWAEIDTARDVAFAFCVEPVELPPTCWHPDFMQTGGDEYGLSEKLLEKLLPLMFPPRTAVHCLRLGELLIIGVPGEMAAELGLDIERQAVALSDAKYVTIGGLANEWISYILSAAEYKRGGYEASVSFYGPTLGECIVAAAMNATKESLPVAVASPGDRAAE